MQCVQKHSCRIVFCTILKYEKGICPQTSPLFGKVAFENCTRTYQWYLLVLNIDAISLFSDSRCVVHVWSMRTEKWNFPCENGEVVLLYCLYWATETRTYPKIMICSVNACYKSRYNPLNFIFPLSITLDLLKKHDFDLEEVTTVKR